MVDMSTLGEVSVEVKANLDQLVRDYAKGRQHTNAFERDLQKVTRATGGTSQATMKLENDYRALARSYDPLHAQAIRYQEDLIRIARLEKAGMLSAAQGAQWRGAAAAALTKQQQGFKGVGQAAGSAALLVRGFVGAIGVGMATQLAQVAVNSLKATAAIKDVALQTGLTTKELQEYRGIASAVGLTTEQMDAGFVQFHDTVGKAAAGATRETKLFELLGISLKDAGGNAKSTGALFGEFVEKMGQVGDKSQQAGALALVFGETLGPKMAQLIGAGTSKIDELREAIEATGMVLSDDQIQKADETARKLDQVKMVLSARIASTVVENADAISTLAEALAQLAEWSIKGAAAWSQMMAEFSKNGYQIGTGPGGVNSSQIGDFFSQGYPVGGTNRGTVTGPVKRVTGKYYDPTQSVASAMGQLNKDFPGKSKGGIDLKSLLAPKGRKGGAGKKAPDNIFEREELQAQQERLRLLRDATASLEERNHIDHQLIDLKLRERKHAIDEQAKDGKLTRTQAAKLKAAEDEAAALEREAADRRMREDQIEQRAQVAEELMRAEEDGLSIQLRLARTTDQRTRIEASLLRLKQQEELLELDKQIALAQEAKDAKRIAELTTLRAKMLGRQGEETQAFAVEHLTGIEKFRNDLPKTVEEINEAIDDIRFDLFKEKLDEMARFAEDVGSAFGRAAGRIAHFENPLSVLQGLLEDLGNTLTQQFIEKPITDWATKAIGAPLAKETMGKGVVGPDALTVEQMNLALNLATQNLNALSSAAVAASGAMGGSAAPAATALGQSATATEQSFSALDPQLAQFGSGLMSILSGLGGGGAGGVMGFLKMGLGLAGAAFGGGMGAGGGGGLLASTLPGPMSFGGGFSLTGHADGGWSRGPGGPRGDKILHLTSDGEFTTNSKASSKFGPLLEGINSGRIPDMPALAGMMGGPTIHGPTVNLGGVHFPHIRDAREARRATRQATSDIQREVARGLRAGYLNQ